MAKKDSYGLGAKVYEGTNYSWFTLDLNLDERSIDLLHCFRETVNSMARDYIEHSDDIGTAIELLQFGEEIKKAIADGISLLRPEAEEVTEDVDG